MAKGWVARGNKPTNLNYLFSKWQGQLGFQQAADSVVSKCSCERKTVDSV